MHPIEKRSNSLTRLLKNPFFLCYALLYIAFLILLKTIEGFELAEPILILLIIGVGFSALAWLATKGLSPLAFLVKRPSSESILLVLYLLLVFVPFLTWGGNFIRDTFTTEPSKSMVVLAAKLIVAVLIPLLLFRQLWGYRLRDFISFSFSRKKHLLVALWMSLVLVVFQVVLGSGLLHVRQAGFAAWQLAIGIPFAFLMLIVEVGLVEEFFFRVLIQSRFAALCRSEVAGVVLMSLIFGLAHAPGMYLRGAEQTSIGASPSMLMAVGYSIVVTSMTGFFLGILWARTRNLVILMLIHAAGDLLPNTVEITRNWFGW